jgi:hypothetical protein
MLSAVEGEMLFGKSRALLTWLSTVYTRAKFRVWDAMASSELLIASFRLLDSALLRNVSQAITG